MTEIQKKTYVAPSMKVYKIESIELLAGSEIGGGDEGLGEGGSED
ncbi:MAG: hypothetical protein ACI4V5_08200 [Prevotella sp.]